VSYSRHCRPRRKNPRTSKSPHSAVMRAGSEPSGACGEAAAGKGVRSAGGVADVSDRVNTSGVSGGVAEREESVAPGGVEVSDAAAG